MKRAVLTVFLLLCCASAHADEQHTVTALPPGTALSPADFDKRFEKSAGDFRTQRPNDVATRFVEYDMAFPRRGDEYEGFGHQGVILIGAMSHDADELPIARVYIRLDGREVELKRIMSTQREFDATSDAAQVYGPHRQDAFYLVPIELLQPGAQVLCDFAVHRTGFLIDDHPPPAPAFARDDKATGADPTPAALHGFLDREYPGFAQGGSP